MYRDAVSQALGRLECSAGHGLRGSVAAGRDQALDLLSWNPDIGLILSDYRLTQGDGLELLQTVGRRWPTVARVLMSGSGDPGLCDAAHGPGRLHPKALEPQAFVGAVERVLGGDTWYPPDGAFLRLGVANRAEAVVSALAKGLIKLP